MKCDKAYRLSYTEKARKIVDQMSLEEKVYLMSGKVTMEDMINDFQFANRHYNWYPYPAGGNERLNVPQVKFCDGPRGVVCGISTCFPVTMLRGATFDTELERRVGSAIGKEIRAHGGNLFGGVCINVPYNPGWGRSQEVYGEDPFHLGAMGSSLVRGVQEENVIACIKHYAFNSMEISRFKVSVDCDKRTEREVFLPHFKDCIDAGAASVMTSYNLYKGVHCGHHDYLVNQVLKKEWDFDGFVMSDFIWGVKDTIEAANGGQDMEMCWTKFYGENLVDAVRKGLVPMEKIDEAALRIVRCILAFTEADDKTYDKSIIGCKEHMALALETAEKGITLIKNSNNVLPFNDKKVIKIAVIGRLADKENIGDHGSSRVFPEYVVTPLKGIANRIPNGEVIYYNGDDLKHAKKLAKSSDAVVFVLGYDNTDEGEYVMNEQTNDKTSGFGGDRVHSLGLHAKDISLVKEVGPANENSVVVLIGGNMIMIDEWKDNVNAILMAYYPGMEGGNAIARILFGDVNPGGKLPFVIPKKESDLPQVVWDTTSQWYDYYHGYAKLEKEGVKPSVPYGFGLSYTTFTVSNASFEVKDGKLTAGCDVINTGPVAGEEVIQLYVGFRNSKVDRPVKLLRGFTRVPLKPGENKRVSISTGLDKLRWYNPDTNQWELEKMQYEAYIGTSSDNEDLLKGTFDIS
jgi:beta-glucosidase